MEDNKWWMIDNLKLAGGTTLSASNTNLDNTTDAAFITAWKSLSAQSTVTSTTAPTWRDATDNINTYTNCQPGVPGVSSDSLTGCGYLYNWFAATAGRGIGSISTGDVAASICPVGWHLPSAGTGGATTTNEFAVLNGAMSGNASPVITNNTTTRPKWKSNGPFQGVYAGYWDGTSRNQGGNGYYWSSSAYSANSARILGFYHNRVNPGSGNYTKWYGLSVRCVL